MGRRVEGSQLFTAVHCRAAQGHRNLGPLSRTRKGVRWPQCRQVIVTAAWWESAHRSLPAARPCARTRRAALTRRATHPLRPRGTPGAVALKAAASRRTHYFTLFGVPRQTCFVVFAFALATPLAGALCSARSLVALAGRTRCIACPRGPPAPTGEEPRRR